MTDFRDIPKDLIRQYSTLEYLSDAEIIPLPSLSHRVYEVRTLSLHAALKLIRPAHQGFISLEQENKNQQHAVALNLAPANLFSRETIRLTQWVENSRPLKTIDLHDSRIHETVLGNLARLHLSSPAFSNPIPITQAIDWNLKQHDSDIAVVEDIGRVVTEIINLPVFSESVSCHGDPICANMLLQDNEPPEVKFIDWEYSHATSPYWDMAVVLNEIGLDADEQMDFLQPYLKQCRRHDRSFLRDAHVLDLYRELLRLVTRIWLNGYGKNLRQQT